VIMSTGIDIIEVSRIRRLMESSGDRFLRHHFTPDEISYCRSKKNSCVHFAGRMAAKEAVYKALRMEWGTGFTWKNIEILGRSDGAPGVFLRGPAAQALEDSLFEELEISLSHTDQYAAATALAWGNRSKETANGQSHSQK
jgi:holo-[acyl-carrier protein] synthase